MANLAMEIKNDDVMTIPLMGRDNAGDMVPLTTAVTPTVVNSDPASLSVVINADATYTVHALVWPVPGVITVEIDDGSLTPEITDWTVVADLSPVSVASNFAAATHAAQPVPAAAVVPPPAPPAGP
jgi:hypothetical protein